MKNNNSIFSDQLKCTYSTISPEDLMVKVIPEYNIENPLQCRFWERGANDTYQIRCLDKYYFLRIYRHKAFPIEANRFEAEYLNYLHENDFPVAYPISLKLGGFIKEVIASEGPRHILVTASAEGEPPDYESLEECHLVGESVAQLHNVSDGFKASHKRNNLDLEWLIEDSMSVIRHYIDHLPDTLNFIESVVKKVKATVNNLPQELLDYGVCHGDLHGGNLHIHNKKVIHFDFEECAFGYRLYDLATFKWGVCRGEQASERWNAFIKGYQSIRSVSSECLSFIEQFVIMREIAETAYGIRHVRDFGYNDIMATDINHVCSQLKKLSNIDKA